MTLEARFAETMRRLLPDPLPDRLGVSVSGGGDSTALMFLAAGWAADAGVALHVVTVDHGLRAESAAEAAQVARQAAGLGLPHTTLRWQGWDGRGNLQDAARNARHGLIDHWRGDICCVMLGHTMDDQAETFCLNLARGSGVAGLSAMGERFRLGRAAEFVTPADISGSRPPGMGRGGEALVLLRPLLGERRAALRDWLRGQGIAWSEDPSNEDESYDRVRIRKVLQTDPPLGLTVEGLAATAARMRRAREALEARAATVARRIARIRHGDVVMGRESLLELEPETRATLLAHALQWVASAPHRPRGHALAEVTEDVLRGNARTLHGCLLIGRDGAVRVTREPKAVADLTVPFDGATYWDRRWLVSGPECPGGALRALGQRGLSQLGPIPGDRTPRAALTALPALYRGDELVAAPELQPGPWKVELRPPRGGFVETLLSA